MGKPVAGEVVIVPFPQTDLKAGKVRPALVLVDLPGDDMILCQITSQPRNDGNSISLGYSDFATGRLPIACFIRPNRLFTIEQAIVVKTAGRVKPAKLNEALAAVRQLFA